MNKERRSWWRKAREAFYKYKHKYERKKQKKNANDRYVNEQIRSGKIRYMKNGK